MCSHGYTPIAINAICDVARRVNFNDEDMFTKFCTWLPLRLFCSREVEDQMRNAQAVFVPNLLLVNKELEQLLLQRIPYVKPSHIEDAFANEVEFQKVAVSYENVPRSEYFIEVYIEYVMMIWWTFLKSEYRDSKVKLIQSIMTAADKWLHRDLKHETNGIQWFPVYLFTMFENEYDVEYPGHYEPYVFPEKWKAGVAWMPYSKYQRECLRHEEILALKARNNVKLDDDPNFICTWALYHANLSAYTTDQMCRYYQSWYQDRAWNTNPNAFGANLAKKWKRQHDHYVRNFGGIRLSRRTRREFSHCGSFNFRDLRRELLPPAEHLKANSNQDMAAWEEWCVMIWVYFMRMKRRHNQLSAQDQQAIEALPKWTWTGDIYWELEAWTLDHFFGFNDTSNRAMEEKIFTFQLHQLRLEEANKKIRIIADPECVQQIRQRVPTNDFHMHGAVGDAILSRDCHAYMNQLSTLRRARKVTFKDNEVEDDDDEDDEDEAAATGAGTVNFVNASGSTLTKAPNPA